MLLITVLFPVRSVMRQFPFVQKSTEEQKYDLFHVTDYNYSREGTDKSSLGTKRLISIKRWSKVSISCSGINHRFVPFNSAWSAAVSGIVPRHTILLLQSHLPRDHETLFLILPLLPALYEAGSTHTASTWCLHHTAPSFDPVVLAFRAVLYFWPLFQHISKLALWIRFYLRKFLMSILFSPCHVLPSLSLLCGAYMCVW